jgi:hypothetical protein
MKRNDSSSMNNRATKKPRTILSDVRIDKPGLFDVICGRGKPYQEHYGNKRLHDIVAVHKTRYFDSKRRDKKGIAEMIVNSIKNDETQPGRFLKRSDDENDEVWEDVSDEVAREKVSHVLRFKYKSSQSPSSEASSESGTSAIPRVDNQSSLPAFQSHPATRLHALEPRQHSLEALRNSRTLPAFVLPPVASRSSYASATQPSRATLNVQRALLNVNQPVDGRFDIPSRLARTAGPSISGTPSGTVRTVSRGAPINVSETSAVNLLSDEQVFLLEALILQTRRARTNTPCIAPPSLRFP